MKRTSIAALLSLTALSTVSAFDQSKLKSFERGSWQQILRIHSGRPMLVHFWGVTCGPCKVELPELGEFVKRNPSVDVVTIDADLVPNSEAASLSMLQAAGLSSAENWTFSDGFAERLRYEIDPAWQGDIPRTILISRNGDMVTIEGATEPAMLQRWSDNQVKAAR
jgi:thiol-disulfide isomerase/thioredoxin